MDFAFSGKPRSAMKRLSRCPLQHMLGACDGLQDAQENCISIRLIASHLRAFSLEAIAARLSRFQNHRDN
jgi:hypothetical protein